MPFPCMNKIHYSDFACWCSCIGNSRMPARTPYRSNICNALLVDVFIGNLWDRLSDFIPETIICECGGYSYCTTVHSWQCHRLHAPQNKPSNIVTSYSYRFLSVTISVDYTRIGSNKGKTPEHNQAKHTTVTILTTEMVVK